MGERAERLPMPQAMGDPAMVRCAQEAIETPEIVENFDRLYGATLGGRVTPLERAIDVCTGKRRDDMEKFMRFVHHSIYLRLPDEAIHALRAAAIGGKGDGA